MMPTDSLNAPLLNVFQAKQLEKLAVGQELPMSKYSGLDFA